LAGGQGLEKKFENQNHFCEGRWKDLRKQDAETSRTEAISVH
jgi:hypothetical protein